MRLEAYITPNGVRLGPDNVNGMKLELAGVT